MCYFSCEAQKITISHGFKMVAKMASIVGDVTGLQQRHHP